MVCDDLSEWIYVLFGYDNLRKVVGGLDGGSVDCYHYRCSHVVYAKSIHYI